MLNVSRLLNACALGPLTHTLYSYVFPAPSFLKPFPIFTPGISCLPFEISNPNYRSTGAVSTCTDNEIESTCYEMIREARRLHASCIELYRMEWEHIPHSLQVFLEVTHTFDSHSSWSPLAILSAQFWSSIFPSSNIWRHLVSGCSVLRATHQWCSTVSSIPKMIFWWPDCFLSSG